MQKVVPDDSILIPDNAECVFSGNIFDVYQWPQTLFDGSPAVFEMLRRPDTVNVLCIVDDHLLVLDDEQPYTGSRKTLPGGRVDPEDSDIVAAAQREVREETGYAFRNWRLLEVTQPHAKIEWFVYILVAWDVTGHDEPKLDAGEKISVHSLTLGEVQTLALAKTGHMDYIADLVQGLESVEQLLDRPEYMGKTVTR
jgi:ADP-ribose pyrophosphatase